MKQTGPLLASGRDCDIFEHGSGLVLRRARDGRSMEVEAQTMVYLRAQGYPVPAVNEISEDGSGLVMERVDGPCMFDAIARAPWTLFHYADLLADLHHRLHEIDAPSFLTSSSSADGDRLVHMDLHPLNVVIGPSGPVVIDWSNAVSGAPEADVAMAWALMAGAQLPGRGVKVKLLGHARSMLVNRFLSHFDRAQVASRLRQVVTWKAAGEHMSTKEARAMWHVVERSERRS